LESIDIQLGSLLLNFEHYPRDCQALFSRSVSECIRQVPYSGFTFYPDSKPFLAVSFPQNSGFTLKEQKSNDTVTMSIKLEVPIAEASVNGTKLTRVAGFKLELDKQPKLICNQVIKEEENEGSDLG
jgi:hypothetical protein